MVVVVVVVDVVVVVVEVDVVVLVLVVVGAAEPPHDVAIRVKAMKRDRRITGLPRTLPGSRHTRSEPAAYPRTQRPEAENAPYPSRSGDGHDGRRPHRNTPQEDDETTDSHGESPVVSAPLVSANVAISPPGFRRHVHRGSTATTP